ncbi:MFS transporter [Streptomyces morookaense]|uniref:MFS transporter n=1 Tax=Streptomyces morookaense TaxID=1970 RepID=A0A7Y7B9R3_STRMO|nr:MFS transporter [Streptomyces morookaense]NVK81176.1 MFS transporter [Streptomyces morookaense]GHF49155.1 MFS transporter [Streptomyces morookaense]
MPSHIRHGRLALTVSFCVQGVVFALLVTRIPALKEQYGMSDGLLPVFLAAVPVLAGVGSVVTERLVRRVPPAYVLRWVQPVVCLALPAVALGDRLWQAACGLGVFGLAVGALDASMNMLGVSLQRAYGRSIMLGFHAAYSLGGIVGASLAWLGAHQGLSLARLDVPVVAVVMPAAFIASRWYVVRTAAVAGPGPGQGTSAPKAARGLLPLCFVMTFAYIGDSTVSNWSATYLHSVLHGSEELATVPYNVYVATTLIGRSLGDLTVRRFGAVAVVRAGAVVAAGGFAVVAAAPGAWVGVGGFTLLGIGLCVIVPQIFAAAEDDAAVARLNVFNYVGFLLGSPLVGAVGEAWSYRGAMCVPMTLVLATLLYVRSFGVLPERYGDGHERPRTADVG